MFETGCVVSFQYGDLEGTGSGILVDSQQGFVITHATLMSSILSNKHVQELSNTGYITSCLSSLKVEILLQESKTGIMDPRKKLSRYQSSAVNSSEVYTSIFSENNYTEKSLFHNSSASVLSVFQLKKLEKIISFLMPQDKWEHVEDFSKQEKPEENSKFHLLLSCFALLKIKHWTCSGHTCDRFVLGCDQLNKGDSLFVNSTPFGMLSPEIFINSSSSGIVSNIVDDVLLMTDARCVPGSEGAPVFCYRENKCCLVAMVIASLCWRSNEWVGLSMACSITEILNYIKQLHYIDTITRPNIKKELKNELSRAILSIPMVVVGSNWGSGVVIGQLEDNTTILLTCSHVVRETTYNPVKLRFTDGQTKATVLYKTPKDEPFDIALLSIPAKRAEHVPLCSEPVLEGDIVYVIGHAIFGEENDLEPTITSGVISKVIRVDGVAVMIQTTCAVHAGASGGAVIDEYGRLVGIPVSNAKDTVSSASFPHVNMCVPVETISPILKKYMKTKDISVLKNLQIRNRYIQGLWTLNKIMTGSKL